MSDKTNVVNVNTLDPAGFRVPASDAKGHSVPKTFRVQPVLSNAMNVMWSSGAFPYKTPAELIRHALVRHIKWLESIGDVPSVSGVVMAANKLLEEDKMYEEYQELFNSLRTRINDYLRRSDMQQARILVTKMRGYFNSMPESYWRTQYEKQLSEYDYLFENAPKVKLAQLSPE